MKKKQRLIAGIMVNVLLALTGAARAELPPVLPTPAPQQVLQQLSASDTLLEAVTRRIGPQAPVANTPEFVSSIHALLQQARETGDQRLPGEALRLLSLADNNLDILLLRADAWQALHQFEPALNALQQVLQQRPTHPQAMLMLASLQTVRGEYTAAQAACHHLLGHAPALVTGSCSSSVLARQGEPQVAYNGLHQLYEQQAMTGASSETLHYAQVTLAEVAEQLGIPAATDWWQLALQTRPNDLYTRIGAARNALYAGRSDQVMALTENYNDVDALLYLRTQALQSRAPAEAASLTRQLMQRVALARQRGDTLHARDQATILLDLLQRPQDALTLARINWENQREPEDTRLLLQAALAANRPDIHTTTCEWLASHHQWHARYPRAQPSRTQLSQTQEAHP